MSGGAARLLFLANGPAEPLAGGGPRRTHQLWQEFAAIFPAGHVRLQPGEELFPLPSTSTPFLARVRQRLSNASRNPYQLVSADRFGMRMHSADGMKRYRAMLSEGPTAVVIEDPRLADLAKVNTEMGAVTALAPWAFDSVTLLLPELVEAMARLQTGLQRADRQLVRSVFTSLGNETISGTATVRNWRLSRLETGFVKAAGGHARYLPYYPVGEAEASLRAIHERRRPERGLLVICGGGIYQNSIALFDFCQRLQVADLPEGCRIVVSGVDDLPAAWISHLGDRVQPVGRLPQGEFDALLARAHAVLIPQTRGFGCMTRVADMLCSGIPTIADRLVESGVGVPPGIRYVDDQPGAWKEALAELMRDELQVIPARTFTAWRQTQQTIVRDEISSLRAALEPARLR